MLRTSRYLLLASLVICAAGASLATLHRDRISFVGKCWSNGNQFSECFCTFNALDELPHNYRSLAISWAHDTHTTYAGNVMHLVVAEARRAAGSRIKDIWGISDKRKAIEAWVWQIGKAIGWVALRQAAPTVAANLAPAAAIVPVVYDASAEYVKARSILDRHCGRSQTFMFRINETREAAERVAGALTTGMIDVVVEAGSSTANASAGAAQRLWDWLKSWIWD